MVGFSINLRFKLIYFYRIIILPEILFYLKATFLFLSLFTFTTVCFSQNFKRLQTQNLKGGYNGFSSFVDYDNNGYLDIFVTGVDFENRFSNAVFYKNNGDNSFTESAITNIPRVIYGDYAWADFDNNGTLDLLYSGTTSGFPADGITKVFQNIDNGCEFRELNISLPGRTNGSSLWADVDSDGLLDIFLTGYTPSNELKVEIYRNTGKGDFVNQNYSFIDDENTTTAFPGEIARLHDLDNDGKPDLVITSRAPNYFSFDIYKNLGDFKFEKVDIALPHITALAIDIGDVNNDNLADLVFTGSPNYSNNTGDGDGDFYVYINQGNLSFQNSFTNENDGVLQNDIELGDLNNDGYLDAINYGTGPWGTYSEITKIYLNNKDNTFREVNHNLPKGWSGGIELGDFDNDSDLDVLYYGRTTVPRDNEVTYIYENTLINNEVPFEILTGESCFCDSSVSFALNNDFDSIEWSFDDPLTGNQNKSSVNTPSHIFSMPGEYKIKATFSKGSLSNTLTKDILVTGPPVIKKPSDVFVCNNSTQNQYDLNALKDSEILDGLKKEDFKILFYGSFSDAENNLNRLPTPYNFQNKPSSIYVRVQSVTNSKCYSITSFGFTSQTPPEINTIADLITCDDDTDGQALFDISTLKSDLIGNQPNLDLELFYENGQQVTMPLPATLINQKPNAENLTARVTNTLTGCSTETFVQLVVSPLPIAHTLPDLIGCDDNNDGISEYFDTSQIETLVLNGQTGMEVTYYDAAGNMLPNPLPNPYTNSTANTETLTVRVSNTQSGCYAETLLTLHTAAQPQINQPAPRFACDAGNGYSSFDLTDLEQELIGSQTGLRITYTDANGTQMLAPLSTDFQNTTAWSQRINIRVENANNALCYSETYVDLEVNALPEVLIEDTFVICDNEPGLQLSRSETFDSWEWEDPAGSIISTTAEVYLTQEGTYTLSVGELQNGVLCTNSYSFRLERSQPPTITKVDFADWSDNNFIEISTIGDGEFEYSLDGSTWQDSRRFDYIKGGVYEVSVRDKAGCGFATKEVILVDYMKVFTPNGDGFNDYWQIEGAEAFPDAKIYIFNRFGKLLKELSPQATGWDGSFADQKLPSDDYWFHVDLGDGRIYKNHFTLKR
ncbi:MAG: hypothetical protein CMF36_06180 [Leeuwenhoekiella sp.]|nr:hypothetical protein [Leeuwenhoekiella sp.]MBA80703.1 hypothetical protein [Leeuwenhoekiella sp.]